jgi:hypothetical protein
MWLDCHSQRTIAERIGAEFPAFTDVTQQTVGNWINKNAADAGNLLPASRQHFDVWQFATADKDAGSRSIGAVSGTVPITPGPTSRH